MGSNRLISILPPHCGDSRKKKVEVLHPFSAPSRSPPRHNLSPCITCPSGVGESHHEFSRYSDHGPLGIGVEGALYRSPERVRERTRLFVEAERIFVKEGEIDVSGRVMVTVGSPDVTLLYGDTVRFLSRLKVPRNRGNQGEFDYAGYLAGRGIYVTGYVESERWVVKLSEGEWRFWRGVEQICGEVRRFLDSEGLHNGPLLKALLIGEKGEVGRRVRETFVRTGTAHLLAISGLHIGIIGTLVYLLAYRLLRLSERLMLATTIRKIALLLVIPPVIFYGLLGRFRAAHTEGRHHDHRLCDLLPYRQAEKYL